jgi:hypothetical protein
VLTRFVRQNRKKTVFWAFFAKFFINLILNLSNQYFKLSKAMGGNIQLVTKNITKFEFEQLIFNYQIYQSKK